ncbi:hypothetical protein AtubIFM56815_003831 [Aspergillus tubingensis]|uniref:Uncharacterized protein n=1 Tax=Aspergillus tubingensis TaxID=5068 RepID=A0A9W6AVT0_ASPTU|nr:hypothetical protein AtubIFM56815_003831 [Aspergillus tubingensis]
MFGLFEDIPKPVAEVWTKRRPEWISATSEVLQYVTDIPDDVSGEEAKKLGCTIARTKWLNVKPATGTD